MEVAKFQLQHSVVFFSHFNNFVTNLLKKSTAKETFHLPDERVRDNISIIACTLPLPLNSCLVLLLKNVFWMWVTVLLHVLKKLSHETPLTCSYSIYLHHSEENKCYEKNNCPSILISWSFWDFLGPLFVLKDLDFEFRDVSYFKLCPARIPNVASQSFCNEIK